jgi:hypothetical protein
VNGDKAAGRQWLKPGWINASLSGNTYVFCHTGPVEG